MDWMRARWFRLGGAQQRIESYWMRQIGCDKMIYILYIFMHAYANRCKYKPAHTATQTHALTTLPHCNCQRSTEGEIIN